METLVPYAIWGGLILVGLSLVAIILFGIRSLASGKVSPVSAGIVLIPIIISVIIGFIVGDWAQAAIIATVIVLGLAALALLLSGIRGLFA